MSLAAPPPPELLRGAFNFAIAASRFNPVLVDGLLERTIQTLARLAPKSRVVDVVRVPGSHEIPWAARRLADRPRIDCVIGLGVLIAGETNHHEMVGNSVSAAFQAIAIGTGIPVINGVIVADSPAQARARCIGKINRGAEFAHAALDMAALKRRLAR